jgi:hypothetical protein
MLQDKWSNKYANIVHGFRTKPHLAYGGRKDKSYTYDFLDPTSSFRSVPP